MSINQYDVIIIGGRCAGASLALRLAGNDLKILLLDRATFPSLPSVPSAPFIHPGTMRLLDELGIPEAEYTRAGGKIERFVVANFENFFLTEMPTSRMKLDRNYFQGIDRCLFDETLWKHAARVPGVTAREGFSVTQMLKDESGTVNGMSGKGAEGTQESFTADLVVGADGRRLAKRHGDTRLSRYREGGLPPERILGLLARWSGLGDGRETTARELLARGFDLERVPAHDPIFTGAEKELETPR